VKEGNVQHGFAAGGEIVGKVEARSRRSPGKWLLAVAIGVVVVVAGCGQATAPTPSKNHYRIVGVAADSVDPYFITIECGAKAEAKKLGVDFTWGGTAGTAIGDEASALSTLVATKPQGVVVAPWSSSAFVAPVKTLMQSGIPVVTVDAPLTSNVQYQSVYTNNLVAGEVLAKPLAKAIGYKGLVAILTYGAGDLVQNARWQGLEDVIHKDYPNIHFLTTQYIGIASATAASTTTSLVLANPDLKAIFTTSGPLGDGAASALQAEHKRGIIDLYSFDAEPVEIQMIRSGALQGTVAQSPYLEGADAVKSLVGYLSGHPKAGKPVPQHAPFNIATPARLITGANVDSPSSKALYLYASSC
jgi:ribose transport system substrate-binding protein